MTAIRGGLGFKNVKTLDRGRCQIAMRHEDTKLKRFTALSETNETGLQILCRSCGKVLANGKN
ncbi:hypothetical protein FIBSPDRAFT_859426 [Athelia psychrophila]|uniref:Uncharacterized protein n=1 Tax=Athelia psychrophila TaxID=1759441 RepID=A0A166L7S6_9AGAM|nr:hypothetical protein FIBSPDRAFT_859426 [Fibularhizoctonia sp. CBS 109695]